MKDEVALALQSGVIERRAVLRSLTRDQQESLLEDLFIDFFAHQHITLQKWAALTGQSAQVDTGYIAQFVASIVLKEPGQGFRGKGDDLADGSEVKGAAAVSGVDRPRWNHNLGTPEADERRISRGELPVWQEYLNAPVIFYLLVDRAIREVRPNPIRVRAWALDVQRDQHWRDLIHRFVTQRKPTQYNLQLHPPVGYDDSIVVNTLGNLDLRDVLVFDGRVTTGSIEEYVVEWADPLPRAVLPIEGRSRAVPYGGRNSRPSRLTGAADLVADIAVLPNLFPKVFDAATEAVLERVTQQEAEHTE